MIKHEKAIFVIPFAGGSSYSMSGLVQELNGVDVHVLELPGRGKRIKEGLLISLDDAVNDLYAKMRVLTNSYREYYIYGHSMGSLLGYLIIQKTVSAGEQEPSHFFVSGRGGPSKAPKEKGSHLLPSNEFRDMLRELGGCPEDVLNDEDLMDFFEPILRADFQAIDSYQYQAPAFKDIAITGFFGSDEETTFEEMSLWQNESNFPVTIIELSGNHFFIYEHWPTIANTMLKT